MKKIILLILLVSSINTFSQNYNWHERSDLREGLEKMYFTQDGNIKYSFYSNVNILERESIIKKAKEYIQENLLILKETEFNDSIDIILVRNREDMTNIVGGPISGMTYPSTDKFIKQKTIICIGGEKNPLKHELMHMVSMCKWGIPDDFHGLTWLMEGLATYADPEAECDGYSFEKKYAYFIQNNKLIDADSLINNFENQHSKIVYNQSAYIVEYLINNYGIEALKRLWVSEMDNFNLIYNISFKEIFEKINIELKEKYKNAIEIDWEEFEYKCY